MSSVLDNTSGLMFIAIVGLLFGAASIGALSTPFLWLIPALALCISITGLMLSRRDDMGGKVPAWIGITLSLFFGTFAISKYCVDRCVLYSEAYSISDNWLKLVVAGEDSIAHQAMLNAANRQGSGISVEDYYKMDKDAAKERDERFSSEPASLLLNFGKDAKVELLKNVTQQFDEPAGLGFIQQVFRVTGPDKEPIEVRISVTRRFNKSINRSEWIVGDCEPNHEPSVNVLELFSTFVTKFIHNTNNS